ncbi:uncharacterized protein LOC116288515 [Actinia tenebrosa]|uniref:Uncharacterized protein LOC116288515 n=1 Tax=Actinia tenebrosa TaxID=6105 RepID=A0A6P8H7A3_ACTTE|nr:uncharacterized protein LOC116288515 [Actinia tenebrosa]
MDEAKAKSNLCTIFCFPKNDGKKSVLGCGCVIKGSDQNLKIATSRKISLSNDVEMFAKFEAHDQIIKLQFSTGGEGFENGDDEIAYVSFDDTEFTGQLPDGLVKADLEDVDAIACFVPVLENLEQFCEKGEFSFYEVVKKAEKCSLQREVGSNKRSLDSKDEIRKKHLEVLGSPILSKDCKFLGIVDFLEVEGNESLLRINYHDGIQRNFVKGGSSTTQQKTVIAQETDHGINRLSPDGLPTPALGGSQDGQQETTDSDRKKLSTADSLADLWNISIYFRDDFSKVLDVKYTDIKYWPHLAEEFEIDKIIYDAFSTSVIKSPTESLFSYLGARQPDFNIKELCESLKTAEAYEVYRIVKEASELREEDLVTEICDKAPNVLDTITLKLDREDRLWINLARARNIPKKEYSSFQSNRTDNRTRDLFDALAAEGPKLSIKNFKDKLLELNRNDLVKILNENKFSDEMPLKDLSKYPDAKSEIETILNNLKEGSLWRLARLYQEEGLIEDIDIERRFRQEADCHSPTYEMMKYVLASLRKQYTIEDLVIKLTTMKREDCLQILEPYLEGGQQDIDRITQGIKMKPSSDNKPQRSSANEEHNGVAATDQSEAMNPFCGSK